MTIDPSNANHVSDDNKVIKLTHVVNQISKHSPESSPSTFQPNTQDVYRVSSEQEEHDNLVNTIKQVPDIREEKVTKIKEALESGHYHISSEKIADRLIQDTILHDTRKLP